MKPATPAIHQSRLGSRPSHRRRYELSVERGPRVASAVSSNAAKVSTATPPETAQIQPHVVTATPVATVLRS